MSEQPTKGSILKEARETKHLSLETVHDDTKIPMDVLKAIEEGYTVRNISPFYLRGFIKMYAQYLEVDVKSVVEDYQAEKVSIPATRGPITRPEDVFKDRLNEFFSRRRKQQIVKAVGLLLAIFLLTKLIGCFVHRNGSEQKNSSLKPAAVKAVPEPTKTATVKAAVKEAKVPPAPAVVAPVSSAEAAKKIMLSVRAKKDSWLQVKADGNVVFRTVLKRGATETWSANDEIGISGKNIAQLEFELNGKMIGALGREDRRAKEVVITKNGLSVKK